MTPIDGARAPVDLDRLADYLEGVLTGAEADAVATLIARDERWASVAQRLRTSATLVTDALQAAADADEPMPDALLQRVLTALPDRVPTLAGDRTEDDGSAGEAEPRHARVISIEERRRRRQTIWGNVAKVAAAAVVLAGVGFGLSHASQNSNSGSSTSAGSEVKAPAPRQAFGESGAPIPTQASGHNYGPADLTSAPVPQATSKSAVPGTGGLAPNVSTDSAGSRVPTSIPPALQRLANGGLSACVTAVTAAFGASPTSADFAFYADQPAVIFRLSDGRVIAVGPDCGLPGKGPVVLGTAN